jgi:hypothetical protein
MMAYTEAMPNLVLLADPSRAGKSTAPPAVVSEVMAIGALALTHVGYALLAPASFTDRYRTVSPDTFAMSRTAQP